MSSLNKVQLIGHLGRDPEVRYTPDGNAVANLQVATTRVWKDKAGERHEETEWTRVVLFGWRQPSCIVFVHATSDSHASRKFNLFMGRIYSPSLWRREAYRRGYAQGLLARAERIARGTLTLPVVGQSTAELRP